MKHTSTSFGLPDELDAPIAQSIEEAILVGRIEDLEAVLTRIIDDEEFPEDLRFGLEALRHFRANYTPDLPWMTDDDRRRVTQYDAEWGLELLNKLRAVCAKATAAKQA